MKKLKEAKKILEKANKQKQFDDWANTFSREEKNKLAPPIDLILESSEFQNIMLKVHWEKKLL